MSLPTDDKSRKMLPIWTYITEYFPDALIAEVEVCVAGNIQHNPELAPADITWAREKSTDHLNTAFRHMFDHARGILKDTDGQYHLAKARWRIGAELQLTIERERTKIIPTPTAATLTKAAIGAGGVTSGPASDVCICGHARAEHIGGTTCNVWEARQGLCECERFELSI